VDEVPDEVGRRIAEAGEERQHANQPALFMRSRREGGEVSRSAGFATRGARRRTRQYVEHSEASKHRWVWCIVVRSSDLVNNAG
jgi:hypothetical protein